MGMQGTLCFLWILSLICLYYCTCSLLESSWTQYSYSSSKISKSISFSPFEYCFDRIGNETNICFQWDNEKDTPRPSLEHNQEYYWTALGIRSTSWCVLPPHIFNGYEKSKDPMTEMWIKWSREILCHGLIDITFIFLLVTDLLVCSSFIIASVLLKRTNRYNVDVMWVFFGRGSCIFAIIMLILALITWHAYVHGYLNLQLLPSSTITLSSQQPGEAINNLYYALGGLIVMTLGWHRVVKNQRDHRALHLQQIRYSRLFPSSNDSNDETSQEKIHPLECPASYAI